MNYYGLGAPPKCIKHDKMMKFHEILSTFDQKLTMVPNSLYVGSFQPPGGALGGTKSVQTPPKSVKKWQKCGNAMNYYCFGASPGSPRGPLGAPQARRGRPGRGGPAAAWAAGRRAGGSGGDSAAAPAACKLGGRRGGAGIGGHIMDHYYY